MKYLRRLPWQVRFALLAPLLVLAALSAAHGSRAYYEWRVRRAVEQALDSFDPETTEFTLFAADWLNGVPTRQKTSAQLNGLTVFGMKKRLHKDILEKAPLYGWNLTAPMALSAPMELSVWRRPIESATPSG